MTSPTGVADPIINALVFPSGAYRERTGFMHELRRDGLDL